MGTRRRQGLTLMCHAVSGVVQRVRGGRGCQGDRRGSGIGSCAEACYVGWNAREGSAWGIEGAKVRGKS